jgi:hypothetical protein|tara:strand:+ start:883 stop:1119 length:237 start_codon:yes stop_codon:yes gene_type:complete
MDWNDDKQRDKRAKGKDGVRPSKKKDKAWKSKHKHSNHQSSHEIDDDILYMMNQVRCKECRVVYSLTLEVCPYCIKKS